MKLRKQVVRRVVPIIISIGLIVVLIGYAPWGKVGHILADFDLGTIIILVILSLAYYVIKTLRFWFLLMAMGIKQPLSLVALSYMSAQPVSLLPAGEVYRSKALYRITGVPMKQSLSQFTMQGLLEGIAMTTLLIISSLALNTLRLPVIILGIFVLACTIGLSRGYMAHAIRLANRLPFVHLTESDIQLFNRRHTSVLTWQWLPFLYGVSLSAELVGAGIAFTSVVGLGGHINLYQASFVYIIPVIVGFVSLLPGGIGLSEQSAIGILLLSHVGIARAVAATLIMRVSITGMGVIYGLIAIAVERFTLKQNYAWRRLKPAADPK